MTNKDPTNDNLGQKLPTSLIVNTESNLYG